MYVDHSIHRAGLSWRGDIEVKVANAKGGRQPGGGVGRFYGDFLCAYRYAQQTENVTY